MPIKPHKGKLIETVIIRYPDFINWFDGLEHHSGFQSLYDYIDECIEIFDNKPYTISCKGKVNGDPCLRPPTYASVYRRTADPVFWCDECNPCQLGATEEKLSRVSSYREALNHVTAQAQTRENYRLIIRRMAEAKGLTGKRTDEKILHFFYGTSE